MNPRRLVVGFSACCLSGVSLLVTAVSAKAGLSISPAGLSAQYFDDYWAGNSSFFNGKTPVLTRNDLAIGFSDTQYNVYYQSSQFPSPLNPWGLGGTSLADEESFSVTWHGFLKVDAADTYVVRTLSDDAITININNTSVLSNLITHSPIYDEGSIFLAVGLYPIEVLYGEEFIHSVAQLEWKVASSSSFGLLTTAAPLSATPGPIPLLGAGAAFAFSRKLRLRLSTRSGAGTTRSVHRSS
jgi:hypothetical protein